MNDSDYYLANFWDLSCYSLVRAELNDAWDAFVHASPQGTIFSTSTYLSGISGNINNWYCVKEGKVKAAIALAVDESATTCKRHNHIIQNPIMFTPPKANPHVAEMHSEQFAITAFLVRKLTECYQNVVLSTGYENPDLRPFSWHNYGSDRDRFSIQIRYTSLVDLHPQLPLEDREKKLYAALTYRRKQAVRYAKRDKMYSTLSTDIKTFILLYKQTFERQDILPDETELEALEKLVVTLLNSENAILLHTFTEDGKVASTGVYGIDNKRAYYLYGGNAPDMRSSHSGSLIMWDAMLMLAERGVSTLDLEGINSPKRGYFKLSFGGTIAPYYWIELVR